MGFIIALLLALTTGVVLTSVPEAAGQTGQYAVAALDVEHGSVSHTHGNMGHDHASSSCDQSLTGGCDHHSDEARGHSGVDCCSMGACHVFHVSVAPAVHVPCASANVLAIVGDEQVRAAVSGRLDRPPRTA